MRLEPLGEIVDESVGLGKQVAGIDQHHRYLRDHLIDEVEHDRRLSAKARGEHMRSGQKLCRLLDSLFGREGRERVVDFLKSALVCGFAPPVSH